MALTADQLNTIYNNVLFRNVDQGGITYFANRTDISDAQVRQQIELSSEASTFVSPVVRLYQEVLGRVPDSAGLKFFSTQLRAGQSLDNIAQQLVNSSEFQAKTTATSGSVDATDIANTNQLVSDAFQSILGRTPASSEFQYFQGKSAAQILSAVAGSSEATQTNAANVVTFLDSAAVGSPNTGPLNSQTGNNVGTSFVLTTGVDSGSAFTGTSGSDTFNAGDVNGNATFTTGDQINGGAGNDTLNITQNAAFNGLPTGASVSNVETVNLITSGSVTLDTSTNFSGLTKLNTTSVGGAVVTAASTTAIAVINADAAALSQPITVNGGSSVGISSTNNVGDVITVGGTTAPTGAVSITSTGGTANGNTQGTITVTGGTTVTVNQLAGNAATTGVDTTGGVVTVNGNASTTAVTVNQTATNTGLTATATTAGVVGYTAGRVVITDVNSGSTTAAGTIATATISSFGAGSTINSGALSTLNLSGKGADLTVTQGALTTPAVTTEALNLNGLTTTGTVTLGAPITTLNLASSTNASTLAGLTAAGVQTLNISGDAKVTLTADTFAALQSVVVTNTAGASLGTALATGTSFTGGAGADSIILTSGFTKAIAMGAGNDSVTYGGPAGNGGSVVAGDGVDTIVMTGTQAASVSGSGTFNSTFSGFEVLSLTTDGGANTIDLAAINGVNSVTASGQTDATINGFSSGGSLTLTGVSTLETIGVTNALLNNNDVFNITLTNSTAGAVAFGTVAVPNVETINIGLNDTGTGANTAATIDTLTLQATSAKSIVVTGADGLNLTTTGNIAVTTFDASGIHANSSNDTAANLAVTYTSAYTGTAAETITGGDGNDILTGGSSASHTATITGGLGADTINGGAGSANIILTEATAARDTVVLNAYTAQAQDFVTGFSTGTAATADAIQLVAAATTAATVAGNPAAYGATTSAALTTNGTAFALTGASSTTSDVVSINTTLSNFGNLGASGVVDGTELLKALGSTNVAASSITATTAGDNFYVVAYQNSNAYVYQVANDANTTVTASEIHLVGVVNNVAQGALVANNFTV